MAKIVFSRRIFSHIHILLNIKLFVYLSLLSNFFHSLLWPSLLGPLATPKPNNKSTLTTPFDTNLLMAVYVRMKIDVLNLQ